MVHSRSCLFLDLHMGELAFRGQQEVCRVDFCCTHCHCFDSAPPGQTFDVCWPAQLNYFLRPIHKQKFGTEVIVWAQASSHRFEMWNAIQKWCLCSNFAGVCRHRDRSSRCRSTDTCLGNLVLFCLFFRKISLLCKQHDCMASGFAVDGANTAAFCHLFLDPIVDVKNFFFLCLGNFDFWLRFSLIHSLHDQRKRDSSWHL